MYGKKCSDANLFCVFFRPVIIRGSAQAHRGAAAARLYPAVSVCSSPVTPFGRKMKGAAHSGRLRVRECSVGGHFRNMSPEVRYLFPETSLTSLPLTHTRMVMSVVSSSQRASIEKSVSSVLNDDS